MNAKPETDKSKFDSLKWILIIFLIAVGVWANYYYVQIDWALRAIGWIILACVLMAIALQTRGGKAAWQFSKEARGELRKVVWPTRQETTQTTLVVVGMVILMALILWGIDSLLLWVVGFLTGQRG